MNFAKRLAKRRLNKDYGVEQTIKLNLGSGEITVRTNCRFEGIKDDEDKEKKGDLLD